MGGSGPWSGLTSIARYMQLVGVPPAAIHKASISSIRSNARRTNLSKVIEEMPWVEYNPASAGSRTQVFDNNASSFTP